MASQPVFRVDVSPELPKAVVFGADTFVGEALLGQLLSSSLQVWAVVEKRERLEERENLKVVSWQHFSDSLPKQIDYVLDFSSSGEALSLAGKKSARFVRLINLEKEPKEDFLDYPLDDWRLIKTAFVYGPTQNFSSLTVINQLIVEAVLNLPLKTPAIGGEYVFPIYLTDLCQAILRALFSPGLGKEEIIILGKRVGWEKVIDQIKEQAQASGRVILEPKIIKMPRLSQEDIVSFWRLLNWEPQTTFSDGLEKTIQFFFQKMEKGELSRKDLEVEEIEERFEERKPKTIPVEYWETSNSKITKRRKRERERPKKKSAKKDKKSKAEEQKSEEFMIDEDMGEVVEIEEDREDKATEGERAGEDRGARKQEEDDKRVEEEREDQETRRERVRDEKNEHGRKVKKRIKQAVGLATATLAFWFIWFWLPAILFIVLGGLRLKTSLDQFQKQNWTVAATVSLKAAKTFTEAEFVLATKNKPSFLKATLLGKQIAGVINAASLLAEGALKLSSGVLGEGDVDSWEIKTLDTYLDRLESELGLLQAYFVSPLPGFLPGWQSKLLEERERIKEARVALLKTQRLVPFLDWILGKQKQRVFLVLLQNNNELRPGGGFIGSFALLRFEKGQLLDFKVHDVYWADGQLKGHVEPPEPLLSAIGDRGWYLRDSNWDPDFPKSAKVASWFLKKETGTDPDGVVAFNLTAAQILLSKLGEVYLPDFNEKITASNLFERAEFYSETNFFPGSIQKMSFLGSLGKQLFEEIKMANPQTKLEIAQALYQALEEKEIMVWTKNEELNQALVLNNWQGEVKELLPARESSFSDYLMIVEANIGVNKANYFLRRGIEEKIKIEETGEIRHLLKIQYENTSQSDKWPGGEYKNFLRLYLPLGTRIENVFIYDPLQGESFKQRLDEDKIKQDKYKDKLEVAFEVKVPVSSRRVVEVEFSQKAKIKKNGFSFARYWQKQSGFGSTPLTLLVVFPSSWRPVQVSPAATVTENGLVFQQQLQKDTVFGVEFSF